MILILFTIIKKYTIFRKITMNIIFKMDIIAIEFPKPFPLCSINSEFSQIILVMKPNSRTVKIFKPDGNSIPNKSKRYAVFSLASYALTYFIPI